MENYIVINGKKAELTEEQLKALGIEIKKDDPFESDYDDYFYIGSDGDVVQDYNCVGCSVSDRRHKVANYCRDRGLLEQRALYETLNRLLWRYSMQHDGDKIDWDDRTTKKSVIYYDSKNGRPQIDWFSCIRYHGCVYFYTKEIAQNAIDEIIIPFMAEHPEFKW